MSLRPLAIINFVAESIIRLTAIIGRMPRQTELMDVRLTLGRDFSVARYLFPLFDRSFQNRYFILDLDEDKMAITDISQVRKIGEEMTVNAQSYDWSMAASLNPAVFYNNLHCDPWNYLPTVRGLPEELAKMFSASNICGRKVGGQKLSDAIFDECLTRVEHVELKSMGIVRKTHPVSDLLFAQNGSMSLRAHQ